MTFKKGDIVRCTSDEYIFISLGSEYTVLHDTDRYSTGVYVLDDNGDRAEYLVNDFELVAPAADVGRKLKLPLLIQVKDGAKYVLSSDNAVEGNVTAISATTGETFANHATEEKAIEYFRDGTWIVAAQVKLKQAVADAKVALEKAEKALADSPTYLA